MPLPAEPGADRARRGAGYPRHRQVQAPQQLSTDGLDDAASMPAELAAPLGDASGLSTGAGNLGGLGGVAGGIGGVVGSIVDSIGSFSVHWPAGSAMAPAVPGDDPLTGDPLRPG